MRIFCSPTKKIGAASRPSDDGNRNMMHMNTPTEINETQKITFVDLTQFAYMCTQSKAMYTYKHPTRSVIRQLIGGQRCFPAISINIYPILQQKSMLNYIRAIVINTQKPNQQHGFILSQLGYCPEKWVYATQLKVHPY